VSVLTKIAVVLGRYEGCDHLALRRGQGVWPAQKHLRQRVKRLCGLGTECHRPQDSRNTFRKTDVCHKKKLLNFSTCSVCSRSPGAVCDNPGPHSRVELSAVQFHDKSPDRGAAMCPGRPRSG